MELSELLETTAVALQAGSLSDAQRDAFRAGCLAIGNLETPDEQLEVVRLLLATSRLPDAGGAMVFAAAHGPAHCDVEAAVRRELETALRDTTK